MYYKLTQNVYWGNWNSLSELKDEVKSVLCVAHNKEMQLFGYNPFVLPYNVPYFLLARKDREFPEDSYFDLINQVILTCKIQNNYPILVHCYAGIHRSPIIAVMASLILDGGSLEKYNELLSCVEKTIPQFETTKNYNYSLAAQKWIEKNLLNNKL